MKKIFLLTTALLFPLMVHAQSAPAQNTPAPTSAPPGGMPSMTLEQARKNAHEHAEQLDKMTPAQWQEREQRRQAFFAKIDKMTPTERQQFFAQRQQRQAEWAKMTPAQRDAAKAKWKADHKGNTPVPEVPGAGDQ